MKANTHLDESLVDNDGQFTDPFFQRFELRPRPTPLQLAQGVSKSYRFPTFYADVRCAMAIFLCDYRRAEAMMPHPAMRPVKMPGRRSVVLFSCYEYRTVMNIAPYNEIAMTIPIMVGGGLAPPLMPLMLNLKRKGYYVFSMPVTSLENQLRGRSLWGLPKVVEEIDIDAAGSHCTTVARDGRGETYLELAIPKAGSRKRFDETGYLYSMLDGTLLKSRTCFAGDFTVTTHLDVCWRQSAPAEQPVLKLGSSARADALRALEIDERPFQLRYAESMNSCFDLPLEDW